MKTFIVSYDLNRPGQDYKDLIKRLEEIGAFRVLYSQWAVRNWGNAVMLRDDLSRFIDANDRLAGYCFPCFLASE